MLIAIVLPLTFVVGAVTREAVPAGCTSSIVAGLLVSSWHIFATTFRRELEAHDEAPLLGDEEPGDGSAHDAARR